MFTTTYRQRSPVELAATFAVSRASYLQLDDFRPVDTAGRLLNLTGSHGDASFSGFFRYETTFDLPAGVADAVLDLGVVGQAAGALAALAARTGIDPEAVSLDDLDVLLQQHAAIVPVRGNSKEQLP